MSRRDRLLFRQAELPDAWYQPNAKSASRMSPIADQDPLHQPQAPGAGWYPDPWSLAVYRYWDGSAWTAHTQGAKSSNGFFGVLSGSRVRLVAACGGLALALAPFFPWVTVVLLGDLNLFQLLNAGGNEGGGAWVAVGIGVGVILVAFTAVRASTVRLVAMIAGLLAGAYAAVALTSMVDDVEQASGLAQMEWGPYIAVAGCAAMVVAALLKERNPIHSTPFPPGNQRASRNLT